MGTPEDIEEVDPRERFHDRLISLLLAAIWIVAALVVYQSDTGIPTSMLFIGTVFFIMLVPAMTELVKIIDKRVKIQLGLIEPDS
jgi:hypothetical protein